MGNTLAMLQLRYERAEGAPWPPALPSACAMRHTEASVALAQEKGAFPKFNADGYLAPGTFASRLPAALQKASASTAFATATCCPSRPPAR